MTDADANNLIKAAESADGADLHISLAGQAITNSEGAGPGLSVGRRRRRRADHPADRLRRVPCSPR